MYNTVSVKAQYRTVFRCGNQDSKEVVLILGSCRVVPFINYLDAIGRYKIYCIDPINHHWDASGKEQDFQAALKALETDEHFLSILREVTIFIHEGLSSFGMLNTRTPVPGDKTIYNFGMSAQLDINIPNFHDVFILFNDFAAIDPQWCKELTEEDQREIVRLGDGHIDRFCGICEKSSFPEFAQFFRDNYLKHRLFHSFNHVSSAFTITIFQLLNEKFLKNEITEELWHRISEHDMYGNNSTKVTELDRKWRAFQWA